MYMSDYGLSCCYKSAGVLFVIVIESDMCLIMMSDYDVWLWLELLL